MEVVNFLNTRRTFYSGELIKSNFICLVDNLSVKKDFHNCPEKTKKNIMNNKN